MTTPNAVLLSIHQNSLPSSPATHGAQVFFNGAEGAVPLASGVQEALNQAVNTEKAKSPAAIGSSVYLMQNITAPGILVECGFLTNEAEAALLQTPEHQLRLGRRHHGGVAERVVTANVQGILLGEAGARSAPVRGRRTEGVSIASVRPAAGRLTPRGKAGTAFSQRSGLFGRYYETKDPLLLHRLRQ